jgi:hypothetical protein
MLDNKIHARVRSTCCGELLSSGVWKLLVDEKEGRVYLGFCGTQEIHRIFTGKSIEITGK